MRNLGEKDPPVEHNCSGQVYYKGCNGCARRLLASVGRRGKQLDAMREYLIKYNDHSPADIDAIIFELY